ncbi:enhancer of split M2 protein [Drosophila guanche]|nr:enhancer of split M2 protein [Drosophila guanche]
MYLDTKNMTASSTNTNSVYTSAKTATAATPTPKTVRRIHKVWQPLRRLLTVGGKGRPAPLTLAHPNNVDLNNTQLQQQQFELILEDKSKSTPEESIYKYGAELRHIIPVEDEVSLTQPPNTSTLISSVYVEKASAQSCGACPHGRNCQHTHHGNSNRHINSGTSTLTAAPSQLPSQLWDLQLPLQYISTDNGTFFWANTQERVDDDLLHALLCQSFCQLPGTLC